MSYDDDQDDIIAYARETYELKRQLESLRTQLAEAQGIPCGECSEPVRPSCKCREHVRICDEQQRADQAEAEVERLSNVIMDEAKLILQLAEAEATIAERDTEIARLEEQAQKTINDWLRVLGQPSPGWRD